MPFLNSYISYLYIDEISAATYALSKSPTIISSEFVGTADFPVLGMNEIHVVTPGDIVFVDHPKYYDKALNSAATVILDQ